MRVRSSGTRLSSYIDHTLLKPDATLKEIATLCAEACENEFFAVCVHGSWVEEACRLLQGAMVRVVSVAGFPLIAMSRDAKCYEARAAVEKGAEEIDVVLNIGRLKQGDDQYVQNEITGIVQAVKGRPVKVILETCLLSNEEKIRACRLAVRSGAAFVKTSTGFRTGGATTADLKLMRQIVGPDFGIKASGGIRDYRTAMSMIEAGATRIGTSSGIAIIKSCRSGK